MFCPNCGHEIRPTDRFCSTCGSKIAAHAPAEEIILPVAPSVEETPAPAPVETSEIPAPEAPAPEAPAAPEAPQEKKSFLDTLKGWWAVFLIKAQPVLDNLEPYYTNKKLVAFLGGGILTIMILLIILGIVYSGNGYTQFEHSIGYIGNQDGMMFIYDDEIVKTKLEGQVSSSAVCLDGSVYTVLTTQNELVVIRKGKATVAADNVSGFVMSVSGGGLVYSTKDGTYYLYNIKSDKSVQIADADADYRVSDITISPDGKTAAFIAYASDHFTNPDLYYFDGEDSEKIGSATALLGISNKGKYIYTLGSNISGQTNIYCYNKDGDKEKIGGGSSFLGLVASPMFNEDHTQILYYHDGKTYIAEKNKEAEKISSSTVTPLLPMNSDIDNCGGRTIPVDDLYDRVYSGTDSRGNPSAWYIDANPDKSCKLVSDVSNMQLSYDAEYLYFIDDDDELCCVEISDGYNASDNKTVVARDVRRFAVDPDRDLVFYISDGNLYSGNAKRNAGRRKVEDDVSSFVMNIDGIVYYTYEGDLYATANGKPGKKIGTDIDGIHMITPLHIYAATDDTIYIANGTRKLKKLLTLD